MNIGIILRQTWRITWRSWQLWALNLLLLVVFLPAFTLGGAFGGMTSLLALPAQGPQPEWLAANPAGRGLGWGAAGRGLDRAQPGGADPHRPDQRRLVDVAGRGNARRSDGGGARYFLARRGARPRLAARLQHRQAQPDAGVAARRVEPLPARPALAGAADRVRPASPEYGAGWPGPAQHGPGHRPAARHDVGRPRRPAPPRGAPAGLARLWQGLVGLSVGRGA